MQFTKTTENSERLGRQKRLEIEPGTSRLPALSPEPLRHWWGGANKESLALFFRFLFTFLFYKSDIHSIYRFNYHKEELL